MWFEQGEAYTEGYVMKYTTDHTFTGRERVGTVIMCTEKETSRFITLRKSTVTSWLCVRIS